METYLTAKLRILSVINAVATNTSMKRGWKLKTVYGSYVFENLPKFQPIPQ